MALPLPELFSGNPETKARPVLRDFKSDFEMARDNINNGLYREALLILNRLVMADPDNCNLNFLCGYCYFSIGSDRQKAIFYLEKAVISTVPDYNDNSSKERSAPVFAFYYLGLSYHWSGRLEGALANLETFRGFLVSKTGKLINQKNFEVFSDVNKKIEQVKTAIRLSASPLRIEFVYIPLVNAGNYSSFGAQLSQDDAQVFYTRERLNERVKGKSDMYVLQRSGGNWVKTSQIGQNLNSPYSDLFNAISVDSRFLLFSSDRKGVYNIFYSMQDQNKWTEPFDNLSINSNFNETYAVLAADGNSIIFVSDRPGGFGGKDLYKIEKKTDGSWTPPSNLGFTVNTAEDEDTPWLSADGNRLYFSSKGHATTGGFDVFYSDFRNDIWGEPVNLGYPVNSVADDVYFKYFPTRNLLIFATNRKGGNDEYEILAARYLDSTKVNELFSTRKEFLAPDSLEAAPEEDTSQVGIQRIDTEVVVEKIDTTSQFLSIAEQARQRLEIERAAKQKQVADSLAAAEVLRQETEDRQLREAEALRMQQARQDSLAKLKQKRVSDSLAAIRLAEQKAAFQKKQETETVARLQIRQDSLAKLKQKRVSDSLAAIRLAEQKAAFQQKQETETAARLLVRQDSLAKLKQKRVSDSLAAIRLAEQKAEFNKQQELEASLRLKARQDSISIANEEQQRLREKENKQLQAEQKLVQPEIPDQASRERERFDSLQQVKQQSEAALARYLEKEAEKKKQAEQDKASSTEVKETSPRPKATKATISKPVVTQPASSSAGGFPDCDVAGLSLVKRYTVQVGAGWMKVRYFRNIKDKKICYGPDGMARFVVGSFENQEEAESLADELRMMGFSDAWVAEIDEKRCVCPEKDLLLQAGVQVNAAMDETGVPVRYTVQVGAGNMKIRYFNKLRQVRVCSGQDGLTRFIFGEFSSLDEATLVKDRLVKMGYSDAWIPLIDENRCGE